MHVRLRSSRKSFDAGACQLHRHVRRRRRRKRRVSGVRDFAATMEPREPRIASYQADPAKVGRVLLLYSGGLDTSVMLRWIRDAYEAEIVTLTVNLGQPGEDYDVVTGNAKELGAIETIVVDARTEFAEDYVLPAIRANALYGGGYPLFTALGRPLIGKLGVEHARRTGCDTIAHGCTGKGNDQVRLEATVATLDPELKVIAPVRRACSTPSLAISGRPSAVNSG
jgi:argininosuccinate synthase